MKKMDLGLKDKVAVVTGGSRGLGRAICLGLAAEGSNVVVNYQQSSAKAAELVEEIETTYNTRAIAVGGDVSKHEGVKKVFQYAETTFGTFDILINNAAIWPTSYVKDMTEDEWNRTVSINMTGPFLTCREAVRRWLASNRVGRIVNVSSQAAFHGSTSGHAHYAASKAGLVVFTVSLAREVARQGIHVNAVAPGMMYTDMAHDALEEDEQRYIDRTPLGRIADPGEIANVIVFLASNRASYMTGATVDVTGGMLMR
jgi:3-oxoacyl-[acyl-carrier protein] reductase